MCLSNFQMTYSYASVLQIHQGRIAAFSRRHCVIIIRKDGADGSWLLLLNEEDGCWHRSGRLRPMPLLATDAEADWEAKDWIRELESREVLVEVLTPAEHEDRTMVLEL